MKLFPKMLISELGSKLCCVPQSQAPAPGNLWDFGIRRWGRGGQWASILSNEEANWHLLAVGPQLTYEEYHIENLNKREVFLSSPSIDFFFFFCHS